MTEDVVFACALTSAYVCPCLYEAGRTEGVRLPPPSAEESQHLTPPCCLSDDSLVSPLIFETPKHSLKTNGPSRCLIVLCNINESSGAAWFLQAVWNRAAPVIRLHSLFN